jgi:hypothetical protein
MRGSRSIGMSEVVIILQEKGKNNITRQLKT